MSRAKSADRVFGIWAVLVFIFLFLPIVMIIIYSFNDGRLLVSWREFGFGPYEAAFSSPQIMNSVWVTLRAAIGAAIVATALGTLAGLALARHGGKWAPWLVAGLAIVTVTPEIVDAVALLPWFVMLGQDFYLAPFNDGIVRLIVGNTLFATALVSFIVRARFEGLDAKLEEASADLYASPFTTFRKVTLPLAMPAVLSGALLSFTLSLDNTVIASFVQVSGSTPWPVYILSSLKTGLRPEIAAMSTVMIVLTIVALALVAIVLRRSGESTADIARTMAA
ncbi:ABC transporter permease [Gulosibacter macacae]|uniref:Spermidine/putrescine transport system permease protein PotC n=1 Tax=Gulosibacter macacae TaxID=2488791 RepID=A0A3P3VZ10_9MICO|nr:ABC transporter permease [Gulosibacter macacae]RRJ87950.1 ABC transporter permease [Gulosibacter macacae]